MLKIAVFDGGYGGDFFAEWLKEEIPVVEIDRVIDWRNAEPILNNPKEARKIAETRVKASLALQAVAVEQKITVSDDLVNAKIAELRDVYKKSPEAIKSLKDPNVKVDIKNRMIIEATLDYLVKTNK